MAKQINKSKEQTNSPQRARVTNTEVKASEPFFKSNDELAFGRQNFLWIGIGAALILLGMILMLGGEQPNPETWDPNIIYSSRIITFAPILILIGIVVEIYAIFKD